MPFVKSAQKYEISGAYYSFGCKEAVWLRVIYIGNGAAYPQAVQQMVSDAELRKVMEKAGVISAPEMVWFEA